MKRVYIYIIIYLIINFHKFKKNMLIMFNMFITKKKILYIIVKFNFHIY